MYGPTPLALRALNHPLLHLLGAALHTEGRGVLEGRRVRGWGLVGDWERCVNVME